MTSLEDYRAICDGERDSVLAVIAHIERKLLEQMLRLQTFDAETAHELEMAVRDVIADAISNAHDRHDRMIEDWERENDDQA